MSWKDSSVNTVCQRRDAQCWVVTKASFGVTSTDGWPPTHDDVTTSPRLTLGGGWATIVPGARFGGTSDTAWVAGETLSACVPDVSRGSRNEAPGRPRRMRADRAPIR